jgi:predicted nucleotidyltransferase
VSSSGKNFREGDFIETRDRLIFDVKGLQHPPDRVIAFLRYYPSETGERIRNGVKYGKVYSLNDRFNILRKRYPTYIYFDKVYDSIMQGVPRSDLAHLYQPTERLTDLANSLSERDDLEKDSVEFCKTLSETAMVSLTKLGLTGSILVGLHSPKSDIDVIVYGYKNCIAVYEALNALYRDPRSPVKPYGENELRKLFRFRSSDTLTEWKSFLVTEKRRRLQGLFKNRDYFLRFIRDWNEFDEKYGDVTYKSLGQISISATVADDGEALFTPCTYKIKDVTTIKGRLAKKALIREVASFRGRFCEIARNGERITARGKLELVSEKSGNKYHRVIVGGEKDDFLTLV